MDFRETNKQVVEQFRANDGVGSIGPVDFEHLVLITTTGRRSGTSHTTPLGYAHDDAGNLLLFASNMGAPRDPDWFRNIAADPHVHAEVTGRAWDAEALVLSGAERDDAYDRWIAMAPHVADHQEKAGRTIPMVRVPPA